MASFPIPSNRSSDLLVTQRLVSQVHSDQLELLRLQTQLSTGLRVSTPSDDAPAAIRAITLQRLLEQKKQASTNLLNTQSFLAASDSAISNVSQLVIEARAIALSANDSTLTQTERANAVSQIDRIVQQLVSVGNRQFRDRYLFSGSDTTQPPFAVTSSGIAYHGNSSRLQSFADVGVLFDSSISGNAIFGGISSVVEGSLDLNPVLTSSTRLADLNGGQGISLGSFRISDGTSSKTIDLAGAETIGDVVRRIEANPPAGREITVRITSTGLKLEIEPAAGANFSILEIDGGTTAKDLGILKKLGVGSADIIGTDLNPVFRPTTSLDALFGSRASALLESPGKNNNIQLTALDRGAALNNYAIQYVDDSLLQAAAGLSAGNEVATLGTAQPARAALALSGSGNNLILTSQTLGNTHNNVSIRLVDAGPIGNAATVHFDADNNVLELGVDNTGATQVQTLIDSINLSGEFNAAYDSSVASDGPFNPAAAVQAADIGVVTGNSGNSGGDANTVFIHVKNGETTANQVVSALQNNGAIAALFDISLDGKDTSSAGFAGLGVIDVTASAQTSGGSGVEFDQTSGVQVNNGGAIHTIDLQSAQTVEDLLNAFNNSAAGVLAEINAAGTGINIRSRLSGQDFSIGENGGLTATQLGIRTFTESTTLAGLNFGRGVNTAAGADFTIVRSDGVQLAIDVSAANTVEDVINAINNHASNIPANAGVTARLAASGNGIELVDGAGGAGSLTITTNPLSTAAVDLGLLNQGETLATAAGTQLTGRDVNPQETPGVFNTLLRLREAIEAADFGEIERLTVQLDRDLDQINYSRAELGARQQNLEVIATQLEDENVQLRSALSEEIEVDVVQAISDLTSRQAAFEASLRLIAQSFQLSLLDFL